MASLHEDAYGLKECVDVLLLFDDDEELHRAAPLLGDLAAAA
jgi:hypothetical protein